ncbi:MAG: DnaJ domain-containing protein [Siculibacillus sp.]
MNSAIFGVAVLVGVLILLGAVVSKTPTPFAVAARRAGAGAAITFAVVMLATGRLVAALPFLVLALVLAGSEAGRYARWVRPFLGRWSGLVSAFAPRRASAGRRSTVRSAALEMELDHDSGTLSGRVLAGRFEGCELARLSVENLLALWQDVGSDLESRSLLEAYLNRRVPLWREHAHDDSAARQRGAASSGAMTDQEAHQVLGLAEGASQAEVREAHRRLMKAVHPDKGGSTFLAAKINEAKDRLVGKHDTRSNH